MRWAIIIGFILIFAFFGIIAEAFAENTLGWRITGIPLLLCLVAGGALGILLSEYIGARRKVKKYDLSNLPEEIADFVNLVVRKMRYREKIRYEVAAELAGHFEDALSKCQTEEERKELARRLIEQFGDARLLAVLLRRAKKRCRPLWRTILARTFQAFGILILLFIVYVVWFFTGRPAITTDYLAQLNQLVRPTVDESLNAAPLYTKAAQLYGKVSDDFLLFFADNYKMICGSELTDGVPKISKWRTERLAEDIRRFLSNDKKGGFEEKRSEIQEEIASILSPLLRMSHQQSSAEERKFIRRWIEEQKQALDLVVEGSLKPYYWQKYAGKQNSTDMMSILLPYLPYYRYLTFSLCWRARLRAEQGRYEDALGDIKSCYRFGRHVKGHNTPLIEQLVGMAIEAIATRSLREILSEYEIESVLLAELQEDFEQIIAGEDFKISLVAEKLSMYDTIQRTVTDHFIGHQICPGALTLNTVFSSLNKRKPWIVYLRLLTHPNKKKTLEMVDRLFAFYEELSRKTPAQIRAEGIDIEKKTKELVSESFLLEMLAPAFGGIDELSQQSKTQAEAVVTIIALLQYKKSKGSYPEDLRQLISAGYLKKLPMDPYTDKPLVYKRTKNDFILYSVGRNFKDDKGQIFRDGTGRVILWGSEGDAVFWPVQN